jgi:hypothetical protein
MIWRKLPADDRDFPGDSKEREEAAIATAGSLSPVSAFIADEGDYEGDHSDATHGTARSRDEEGMGYATPEEIETYYDSLQPEDIKLK